MVVKSFRRGDTGPEEDFADTYGAYRKKEQS